MKGTNNVSRNVQSDKGIQDFHQHGNFAVLLLPVAVIEIFTDIIFNYYIVPLRCRSYLVSEIETEAGVRDMRLFLVHYCLVYLDCRLRKQARISSLVMWLLSVQVYTGSTS